MLSLQSSVSELPKFWAATFCPNPNFLSYERGNCHNSLLWFSDTLNELFVVNCLISRFFCENTRWKLVSSSHYLKLLIKSTMHGLSYSLKCDLRSISKFTFVSPFDTEPWKKFLPKMLFLIQIIIILVE